MKFILVKLFEDKSISKVFLVSLLGISLLSISILGLFWIQQANEKFKQESKQIQEDFFKTQEKTLLQETQTLINFIENEREQTRNSLKDQISKKVYEAHTIATNIYNSCKNELSQQQIQKLIIDALRPIKDSEEDGFFFINNLNGTVLMDPEKPDWEGKNKKLILDVYGVPIIKKEIEIAKKYEQGFTNYSWQNENGNKIHPKISFIKVFKPFNWYIGYTKKVDNHLQKIKDQILSKITEMRFDENFTIIVLSFDGTCLAHTQKEIVGQDLWRIKDENGKKITQEFISQGTNEKGGFIRYQDPFITGNEESKSKLMYAKSYKDWQWIIGSGIHIMELKNAIQKQKDELKASVNSYFIKAILIFLLSGLIIVVITRFVVQTNKSGLKILSQFYKDALTESQLIDTSKLHFKEYKTLGEHANQMILNRKKIEHQLNIETAYFEQLFENSPEAIAITDHESKGIKINRQFTKLFGYTTEDIYGIVIDNLLADESKQSEANNINEITSKGQLIEIETERKCKDGTLIDVSIMGNPIEVAGEQIAIFGIYRNITDRKHYEKHLKEAKSRAEESDNLKSAFLANMSHEIRTPMNHILGFTDIMSSTQIDESDRQEYAGLIKQSGTNLLQLINDMIDLSKIESKQIKLHKSETSVNTLLASLYEKHYSYKNTNQKENLILQVQKTLSDEDSIIFTDAGRLEQLLSNLIENAIKFTKTGIVEFGYHLKDRTNIEFYIKDTGIGIPEKSLKDIFQSFRQIDDSDTRKYSGTGLGLTITHRLTEILGGSIRVESEVGKGTCFFITLPYIKNNQDLKNTELISKENYNWKGKNILVVDDEKSNFTFYKASLAKTNADVLWAKSGHEAINLCNENKIDLVLMDIQMPEMNGYDATKKLKDINSQIPIIGNTAFFQKEYKQKVIAAGCDDYLTKPIKIPKLLDSINKQLIKN